MAFTTEMVKDWYQELQQYDIPRITRAIDLVFREIQYPPCLNDIQSRIPHNTLSYRKELPEPDFKDYEMVWNTYGYKWLKAVTTSVEGSPKFLRAPFEPHLVRHKKFLVFLTTIGASEFDQNIIKRHIAELEGI